MSEGCRCKPECWQAWQSPLVPPTLHVEGKCVCPDAGYEPSLRRAPLQGSDERVVFLELVVTPSSRSAANDDGEFDVYYFEPNFAVVTEVVIENCGVTLPVEQIR